MGVAWPGAPHPLQVCVRIVSALLSLPLPALLLLPAALAAGGVACQLHLLQVAHLWLCCAACCPQTDTSFLQRAGPGLGGLGGLCCPLAAADQPCTQLVPLRPPSDAAAALQHRRQPVEEPGDPSHVTSHVTGYVMVEVSVCVSD